MACETVIAGRTLPDYSTIVDGLDIMQGVSPPLDTSHPSIV